jgi:serine/threonine protein kinase/ABC-type branched-subunit amino acid transport system substrate-binding protein
MECPYCKAQNRDGVRYCGSCGKQIGPTTPSVAAATPGNSGSIPRSLLPGSRLQGGRYLIKQVLGEGGMGTALLAQDMRLDSKLVVIKELLSEQTDPLRKQEEVRNFKREVSTLAHIDHPLVPNVTDHFQEGTRYFMVQEYVEGENLEQRLERTKRPMGERDALLCASEVLDILEYLAQQTPPIVHRDIKPANIIIGAKDKRAHLVDFGIARADETKNAQRKQTAALGTPGYAPPEQYQGNADPRADLYALAATVHHIVTNRDPRNSPPFIYPPARSLNTQLTPDIERILARELVNDINQRYQSALAMKQDIDAVLQRRFGMMGNASNYMLGTSGTMGAIIVPTGANTAVTPNNSLSSPNLPTISNQPTRMSPPPLPLPYPGAPPFTPPPNYYQPLNVQNNQPKPPSRRRTGWLPILLVLLLLLLVLGGAFGVTTYIQNNKKGNTSTGSSTATTAPASPGAIGVTKIGDEYIGISDGNFAFDTGRTDNSYKEQAVNLFKQSSNNASAAIPLLDEAVQHDTNDAEALIYREDMRVISSGSPYVTFVVATMLSDKTLRGVGRDDLQGAYVAQKEYNDNGLLQGGVKVRLLIANSGSQTQYADQVAGQIVQLAKSDPTFVGVMGWPYSSRSLEVVKTLTQAGIPIVSQTSSSDDLTNISPYFFRVAPANKIQGIVGARYAEHTLNAKSAVVFVDPSDSYSQSLAQDFSQQFQADGQQIVATEDYTKNDAASISVHIADALSHHPDIIYFSGYASDVDTLISNPLSGTIPVMGGDALYELSGYPHSGHASLTRLHFTTFAYPDEWEVLGYKPLPAFFTEYPNDFDPNRQHKQGSPYGFTRADNDVILSYDATIALLKGINNALSAGKTKPLPADLEQGLKQISGVKGFQGVSGQITFGSNDDPVDKAIVVLHVSPQGYIQMEPMGSDQGLFLK